MSSVAGVGRNSLGVGLYLLHLFAWRASTVTRKKCTVNKKEIMRQTSLGILLREMVKHQPGVTSNRLFETAKEWAGGRWDHKDTVDFEAELAQMNGGGFRVTNKQWYEVGHVSPPKRKGPSKEDPRQLRMFG